VWRLTQVAVGYVHLLALRRGSSSDSKSSALTVNWACPSLYLRFREVPSSIDRSCTRHASKGVCERETEREEEREREHRSIAQSQGEQLQGSNLLAENEAPKADFCSSRCMQLPMLSGCLNLNKTGVNMHPKAGSHLKGDVSDAHRVCDFWGADKYPCGPGDTRPPSTNIAVAGRGRAEFTPNRALSGRAFDLID
jgi:hypothetical protein